MSRLTTLVVLLALPLVALAEDWPQWLGPRRDGTSTEVVKPWTGQPKVLWRVPVGEGHSSPVVVGNRVYLFFHEPINGQDAEILQSFDTGTGMRSSAVSTTRGPFASPFGVGPRSTPACQDGWTYRYGVTGRLSSHFMVWTNNGAANENGFNIELLEKFHAPNLKFGISASPLLEGDNIIVLVGGKGAGVVAIDRKSGEVAWQSQDDPASYSSPIATGEGEKRQIICLTGISLIGLSPKDGSLYWRYPFKDLLAESSTTPVVVGDLLIGSSVTLGSVALRLGEKDGKPAVTEVWKNRQLNCYFSTPVPVGDHLYMINGVLGLKPSITLHCVETRTGKIVWSKENVGKYHAALLRTGDSKLLMLDDTGHLTLIDPDPKGCRELARSKVCDETWAHPALADGRLYLRDQRELICLSLND